MIRLLRAELMRFLSRRFTILALLAVLLGVGAFQIAVYRDLAPPSAADRASAQQAYEQIHTDWENSLRDCQASGTAPEQCQEQNPEPQLGEYQFAPDFRQTGTTSIELTVYLVALALFLVAGSFIGAEYSTGAISNWLTFVPRRGPVFWSKLATVGVVAAVVAAAFGALTVSAAFVFARLHGLPPTGLRSMIAMAGRGVLPGVALAVVGFCVGLLTRHTAAAIGVLAGYLFVVFVRVALLSEQAFAAKLTRWSPEGNLAAIVERGHRYYVPTRAVTPEGMDYDVVERTIGLTHGLLYWAVLLVALIVATRLVFGRRDVA